MPIIVILTMQSFVLYSDNKLPLTIKEFYSDVVKFI